MAKNSTANAQMARAEVMSADVAALAAADAEALAAIVRAAGDLSTEDAVARAVTLARSATAQMIAAGGILTVAKHNAPAGAWEEICKERGAGRSWSYNLMTIYECFRHGAALEFAVETALSAKQMLEIARLPADKRETLVEGGAVGGVSAKNIAELGGRQLRLAFEAAREEETPEVRALRAQTLEAENRARAATNAYQNERNRRAAAEGELTRLTTRPYNALPARLAGLTAEFENAVETIRALCAGAYENGVPAADAAANAAAATELRRALHLANKHIGGAAKKIIVACGDAAAADTAAAAAGEQ